MGGMTMPPAAATAEIPPTSESPLTRPPKPRLDPRLYQIAVLSGLLGYGYWHLRFDITAGRIVTLVGSALLAQYACTRVWRLPRFDPKSALISSLSLCLLLRTGSPALAVVTSVVTIASKFVLRWNGKHVFNPTNFGLVFMMLATGQVWVSPGQWGSVATFGFLMACLGGLVVNRAARSDVTYAFLGAYAAILVGRSMWLGQPLGVPIHRLESGALILFSFFMISDPKTTPDSRTGRVLFSALVAGGAGMIQLGLYRTNGLLWSLAAFSMLVPLIDRLLPGPRYEWNRIGLDPNTKGALHAENPDRCGDRPWDRLLGRARA